MLAFVLTIIASVAFIAGCGILANAIGLLARAKAAEPGVTVLVAPAKPDAADWWRNKPSEN